MDRQLLARATENSDAPTPGYMYNDIAKNAASNPAVCSDVAKYLTGRLASKNNHNIKYKCLKVIAKTATSPYLRGQFKRCLSIDPQAMGAIKDALQFRGPPDPVRGDEPYERVRVAAKEALDSIYSDTPADQSAGGSFASAASSSYGQPAGQQGFSSQNFGSSSNPAGRRMEGIGNPMFKDPRMEPDTPNPALANVISEAKDTIIGMIKDPLARNPTVGVHRSNLSSAGGGGGGYSGSGSYNPQSSYPPGRSELMQQTNGAWTMKSNRGPEAVVPPPNYQTDSGYYKSRDSGNAYAWAQKSAGSSGGVGGSWASSTPGGASQPSYGEQHQSTPSITVSGGSANFSGGGGTAVADGSYEKQLIMELCPPGGMKAEPPPDKLNSFARSVSSLNPDLVCPVLLDCLEDGQPWIIRAKALCVMECCIRNGQKPGASINPYADFFHACGGEIAPLTNHARAAIKDPAKRVLGLLGIAVPVGGSSAVPVSHLPATPTAAPLVVAPAPTEPAPNLLDFGDTVEAAKPPPEQPPPPPPAEGASLFGGLTVAAGPAPALTAPSAAPASGNLLGDFMSGAEQAPSASSGQNMFGDLNVKSDAPVAKEVAQTSSMFENLEVKSEETNTEVIAPAPAASAFGFMNQAAPAETTTTMPKENTPPAASAAVPASWDSFDPLNNNVTPNTAKKMAQISPQQMQALAYQQMIMQQQMQMAQVSPQQMQAQALAYQQMMAMQRGQPGMFQQRPGGMAGNMVMQNPAAARTSFAFLDGQSEREDDKSFDFVKDAITMEKKK
ncbi:MAG: hypothetical protein SGBAC_007760 [Bacillariaceae sp.]